MKPVAGLLVATAFLLLPLTSAGAETVTTDGFASADQRILLGDGAGDGDGFGKVRLGVGFRPRPDFFFRSSVELRYYDLPLLETLPEVDEVESDYPTEGLLWEAFLAIDGVLGPNLDLKLGKQRIPWGRADGFNPTDNLNPDDLTDFFQFGAKLPSWAVQGNYYLGESTFTAIWLPYFEPALLPRGGTVALFGVSPVGVVRPQVNPDNAMYAVKVLGLVAGMDYSLSYFRGFDALPLPVPGVAGVELRFSELEVLGFDFAGEFRSIGFRGEAALFQPVGPSAAAAAVIPDRAYLKSTLGADYTFRGGFYLGVQAVRGFPTERGAGHLNDFLVVTIKQSFLRDELKASLTAAFDGKGGPQEVASSGSGLFPEISYSVLDNLEASTGAYLLSGEDGSVFGRFRDAEQLFLRGKFTF